MFVVSIAIRFNFFTITGSWKRSHLKGLDVLSGFLLFLIMQALIAPLFLFLFLSIREGMWVNPTTYTYSPYLLGMVNLSVIFFVCTSIIFYGLLLALQGYRGIWNPAKKSPFYFFFFGMMTWLVSYPLVVGIGEMIAFFVSIISPESKLEQLAVKNLKTVMQFPGLFKAMIFSIIFLVPIVEEFLFRGLLQNWLKQIWGMKPAIIIASIIFALFHFSYSQGIGNIELLTSLFVLSCFLGFIYEREGSLWAPIGLHMTFNAISTLFILFSLS